MLFKLVEENGEPILKVTFLLKHVADDSKLIRIIKHVAKM
jgi:hypothetical protein